MATVMNTTTTYTSGSGATSTKPNAYYDKLLLELLVQTDFLHSKLAQERPMPKRSGDTINFRRITKLTPSLTPITEGVTPDGLNGSIAAISATSAAYGEWMQFSDMVDVTLVDPILKEYTVELARAMREKLDILVREEIVAGSNVLYAGTGRTARNQVAVGDKPTVDQFRKAALQMKKNLVKPAAGGKYVALVSPEVVFDLMDDPKFIKAYEIAQNGTPFIKGEIAEIYGIKFVEVLNAKVFTAGGAASANVHASLLVGKDAYGITKISGEGVETIVKALGSSGSDDPLNQRQTIGVKTKSFVAKRLTEQAIVRIESVPTNA